MVGVPTLPRNLNLIQQLKIKDYPFDGDWNFIISQPQWLQTHLHEYLIMREKSPKISPAFILK